MKLNDINDNCPQLDVREYYAVGVPPMTVSPYMKINATDEDSTFNAELEHRVTTPVLELVYYYNRYRIVDVLEITMTNRN